MEIICVDDGSVDESGVMLRDYSESQRAVKIITQDNRGVSAARNAGLDSAKGEYVLFLDSDDFLEPDVVGPLLELADDRNGDIVRVPYYQYYPDHEIKRLNRGLFRKGDVPPHEITVFSAEQVASSLFQFSGTTSTGIYRRSFLDEHKIRFNEDLCLGEDALFVWTSLLYAKRISYSTSPCFCYRRNREGSTLTSVEEFEREKERYLILFHDLLVKNGWLSLYRSSYTRRILDSIYADIRSITEISEYNKMAEYFREEGFDSLEIDAHAAETYLVTKRQKGLYRSIIMGEKPPFSLSRVQRLYDKLDTEMLKNERLSRKNDELQRVNSILRVRNESMKTKLDQLEKWPLYRIERKLRNLLRRNA
jgi:glycosyltransferase involved in cell wall biosynthesis